MIETLGTDSGSFQQKQIAFLLPDMTGGGAERVVLQQIANFVAAGHRVDLLLMSEHGVLLPEVPQAVRIIDLRAARIRNLIRPLRNYLATERPDVLQAVMWPVTSVAVIARLLSGSRARLVLADHTTLSKQYSHFTGVRRLLLKKSIGLLYPLADGRVAVSGGSADDLSRLAGINRDSIQVIYNPVSARRAPEKRAPPTRSRWHESPIRILTVGNLKPEKDHILLIRAFARAFKGRAASLAILGEGNMRAELERLALDEGVADQVVLPGFVRDLDLWYDAAHLFALSSRFEGYPLVVIEAMRSGLTVVSTDCDSGPREILDGGRYGLLVPVGDIFAFADALIRAADNPFDSGAAKERANAVSGEGQIRDYFHIMLGPREVPAAKGS